MNKQDLNALKEYTSNGESVSDKIALEILNSQSEDMPDIFSCTNSLRIKHFGKKIHLCSILNAKSGSCEQDCTFCAQSAHHKTKNETYDFVSQNKIVDAFRSAGKLPIGHFGVVTSGGALSDNNIDKFIETIKSEKNDTVHWCASLGLLTKKQLVSLKEAGLKRFHHNLETAQSFFSNICTTHEYSQRLDMVRNVKEAGLELCCGGIMGLGESKEQRVEFARTLQREKVDAIPLNFLIPVTGTPMEGKDIMPPMDIIRIISMFRMVNPTAEIKVCAGRIHLRDLQSMIFYAGATGMMVGQLLTIAGREVPVDMQMLEDLEVEFNIESH